MSKILILEDHPETRQWLVEMVQSVFVNEIKEAASLAQANQLLTTNTFDLALVDLNLPDGTGTDLIKVLNKTSPETYIVVATVFDDDEHLFPALEAVAQGYLLTDLSNADFVEALKGIIKGEAPISPLIARKLISHFNNKKNPDVPTSNLTQRESDILALIASGLNRTEISTKLSISPHTVASHVKTTYRKLNVSSRAEATLEALRLGLISTN